MSNSVRSAPAAASYAALAPAASPYDDVPYPSIALPQTHPDRLATIATLLGLEPAPVDHCGVLELGCGDGSNLIALAVALPGSRFTGVDLAARPVAAAQATAARLALDNATFHHLDLLEVSPALGEFDYVIAHGVYSWVPPPVRDKLLAICRENLAPHGIAYVSYNVFPGGHLRQMVREMMLFHLGRTGWPGDESGVDPNAQIAAAAELTRFLAAPRPTTDPYHAILHDDLQQRLERSGAYVFHDDLATVNTPVYFTDFMQHATAHGLQYLCEADFFETQDYMYSSEVRAALHRFAGDDVCRYEQYLDFLKCRRFRQTLLCHKERALSRPATPDLVPRFYVSSTARPMGSGPSSESNPEASSGRGAGVVEFRALHGATLQTDHAVAIAAITHLGDVSPRSVSFDELLQVSWRCVTGDVRSGGRPEPPATAPAPDSQALSEILLAAFGTGLVELHVQPQRLVAHATDRPVASPLARAQIESQSLVTNLRLATVKIEDELGRRLLQLLDGTRDRAALLAEMTQFLQQRLAAQDSGGPLAAAREDRSTQAAASRTELDRALAALPSNLETALDRLAKLALLVA